MTVEPCQTSWLRFRIDVTAEGEGWKATVYDCADHGLELPYASVSSASLETALKQASHYALVAE